MPVYSKNPRLQRARISFLEWFKTRDANDDQRRMIMADAGVTSKFKKTVHHALDLGYFVFNGHHNGKPKRQSLWSYFGRMWKGGQSDAQKAHNANPTKKSAKFLGNNNRVFNTPDIHILYLSVLLYLPPHFDLTSFRIGDRPWADLIQDPTIRKQFYFGKWLSSDGVFAMRRVHFTVSPSTSSEIKLRLLNEADPCICLEMMVTLCKEMFVAEQAEGFWMVNYRSNYYC